MNIKIIIENMNKIIAYLLFVLLCMILLLIMEHGGA